MLCIGPPACPAALPAQHDHGREWAVADWLVQNGRELQVLASLTSRHCHALCGSCLDGRGTGRSCAGTEEDARREQGGDRVLHGEPRCLPENATVSAGMSLVKFV
jgi:hypothetical protein